MYLGRPWGWQQTGGDASTVFVNTAMANIIKPAGWLTWNSNETNAANGKNGGNPAMDSRYAEYNTTDLITGNPSDPNYSWPAYWGDRNINNDTNNDTTQNDPGAYTNPSWSISGDWDPTNQLALAAVEVPEPATAALVAGCLILPLVRRPRRR